MREFPFNLTENIFKGLRNTDKSPLNRLGLTKLYNSIVRQESIEPVSLPTAYISKGPQLLSTINSTFAAGQTWTDGTDIFAGSGILDVKGAGDKDYAHVSMTASMFTLVDHTYEVKFAIDNYSSGAVKIKVGGTYTTLHSGDGEFTETITAVEKNTDIFVEASGASTDLDITSIYVRETNVSTYGGFPQLFRGKSVTLLCYDTLIASVNTSTREATAITFYDAYTTSNEFTVSGSGMWHFVDMYDAWYLFNGNNFLFYTKSSVIANSEDKHFGASVAINSGTEFKGRVVVGGLPSTLWNTQDWKNIWENWKSDLLPAIDLTNVVGDNYVFWSSIGDGLSWLVYPDQIIKGYVSNGNNMDDPILTRMIEKNDFGWMPLPTQGSVLCVKPVGKVIAVYCTDSVFIMYPVYEPIPTFGFKKVLDIGILQRNLVGGNDQVHFFIDSLGYLWAMPSDGQPKKLGFQEFLSSFKNDATVRIILDPTTLDAYITNNTSGYIFSKSGMSSSRILNATFIDNIGGSTLYGLYNDEADANFYLTSGEFDMHRRGVKHIKEVILGLFTASATVQVSIYYRYNKTDSYTQSSWTNVNKEGIAYIRVSGVDFKIAIKASDYSDVDLSSIEVRWNATDKRFIRGIGDVG